MAWYLFEPEKKYPFAPLDRGSQEGDIRFPLAILSGLVALVLIVAGVVGIFIGAGVFSGWAIGLAVLCVIAAQVLLPSSRK